ncbi:MAG TPA: hypothetical protein VG963_23470 [Polyangiaceae bacterium]|nr:hypothetical protein [Polyangiaceae bacterium]
MTMRGRVMRGPVMRGPVMRGPVIHGHGASGRRRCCGSSPRALFEAITADRAHEVSTGATRVRGTSAPVTTIHSQSEAHGHPDLDSDLHSMGESGM